MRTFRPTFLLILVAPVLVACGAQTISNSRTDSPEEEPGRREYMRQFWETGTMTLVYGSQGPDGGAAVRSLLESLQQQSRRLQLTILSDREVTAEQLGSTAVFLVGSPESNRWMAEALKQAPVEIDTRQLRFDGRIYDDSSTVFMISFYPNPWNPRFSMGLTAAANEEAVLALLRQQNEGEWRRFFRDRWGYELFQGGQRLIMGQFSDHPESRWQMDKAVHWDLAVGEREIADETGYRLVSHGIAANPAQVDSLRQRYNALRSEIRILTGKNPSQKIAFHYYPSAEFKGLKTGNTDHAHVNFRESEVHLIWNPEFQENDAGRNAEIWLRETLGKPATPALETGMAIRLAPKWQKKGYRHWAEKLHRAHALPASEAFCDPETFSALSPLVRGCAAALWVDFLIREKGHADFFQQYAAWTAGSQAFATWEKPWRRFLEETFPDKPQHAEAHTPLPFLKGFNFGHEGYQIYNGYASARATASIASLHDIGANALSVIPYSFMRDPQKPSPLPFAHSAGDENDEGLIHSAFEARARNMRVMMKPQIWLGGGSWPGDIEMQSREDWAAFFRHYEAWVVHYALLAEIHEMDMLCIGTEMAKTTLAREQDWRHLIRKLRLIYSGPLVYAANWGEEFENLRFWDELDYIGLDCYYPLTKANKPSDAELLSGFRSILGKVEKIAHRNKKPVILTEIGFRSIEAPWKQPHESSRGPALSMECQERCYRVVAQALPEAPFIEGIFWWKWPSTLENGGPGDNGFGPNGKPAEKVVEAWFRGQK